MAAGERVVGIHLILSGEAVLTTLDGLGHEMEIARVGRGKFFGGQSLVSGNASEVTVTTVGDVDLPIIESEGLQAIMERTPQLPREVGHVMEARRKAILGIRVPAQDG